jgi:hypothetical protein
MLNRLAEKQLQTLNETIRLAYRCHFFVSAGQNADGTVYTEIKPGNSLVLSDEELKLVQAAVDPTFSSGSSLRRSEKSPLRREFEDRTHAIRLREKAKDLEAAAHAAILDGLDVAVHASLLDNPPRIGITVSRRVEP